MAYRRCLQLNHVLGRVGFGATRTLTAVPKPQPSSSSSQDLINSEQEFSAHNYHPIPVVFSQAKGSCIWDPEGKRYLDFLSAYSAVNQRNSQGKRRMNSRTSMAQREDRIQKTVYVSDIDQQVTEEQLAALFVTCGQKL